MPYRGKRVLITGGLGFIGSNLAIRLAEAGAKVTILDPTVLGCGGNSFNVERVRDQVEVLPVDMSDVGAYRESLSSTELIFNLAGEISHLHSMEFPERDLAINTTAQLRFLLACKELVPAVRIVYAGTRQVYGVPAYLPVDERHAVNPVDFNGVHKYAATMYHLMLTRTGDLDAVVLRLTNVYGPRMALDIPCQGFLSTYIRRVLFGQTLEVFGDGRQLRDPLYVDDAVDAFLRAGTAAVLPSRSYNVGGREALSLAAIATISSRVANVGDPTFLPFPEERKAIDIGSYYTDSNLIREELGWQASVSFEEGMARTLAYYREHLPRYIVPLDPNPPCRLHQAMLKSKEPSLAAV